jgi:hypothetical protein
MAQRPFQPRLLFMFAGPVEKDISRHVTKAREIYRPHNTSLAVWPFEAKPVIAPYQALLDMTGSVDIDRDKDANTNRPAAADTIRKWARLCFADRIATHCPVVFCRLPRSSNPGVTFHFPDRLPEPPRSLALVDPKFADALPATLAHEIGHAAGLSSAELWSPADKKFQWNRASETVPYRLRNFGHSRNADNLMFENEQATGSALLPSQLDIIRRSYFAAQL